MRSILPGPPVATARRPAPHAPRAPLAPRTPLALRAPRPLPHRGLVTALALAGTLGAARAAEETPRERRWEGAVGLIATWAPEYDGASASRLSLVPAGFVRYGRISISGAGGFTTRRSDDVDRGVAASVLDWDTLHVRLGLRVASGRDEGDSDRLAGMGDIDRTLRAQLSVRWRPWRHWTLSTAISADVLGKGNGWWLQTGVHRNIPLGADTSLDVGASMRWAGEDYARRWFGVSPVQSAASGYPVFTPGGGPSDFQLSTRLRTDFGPDWSGFVGGSVSWQLGDARDSPLTQRALGWSFGSGLVRRF